MIVRLKKVLVVQLAVNVIMVILCLHLMVLLIPTEKKGIYITVPQI
jgi:hypothetical protein